MAIHGWSGDCQSNFGVWGYSDIVGGIAVDIHGEWQSTDSPGSVRVTSVYGDTLTYGGGGGIAVAIHGWSGDCQSNSGVWGYSDIGGGGGGGYSSGYPWMVRGLSE